MKVNNYIFNSTAKIGNLLLVKNFLENNQIPKDIDNIYFSYLVFQNNIWKLFKSCKIALMLAYGKGYTEIANYFMCKKFKTS